LKSFKILSHGALLSVVLNMCRCH